MSNSDLRHPKASSTGFPSATGIRSATYQAALNNFPILNFSVDIGQEGRTSKPPVTASMKQAGQAQAHAGEGTVNVNVKMEDGNSGSLIFKGLHTGPTFNLGTMAVGLQFGGVHEAAGVIALNMASYVTRQWYELLRSLADVSGSIPERITTIIDLIVADWKKEMDRRKDSPGKQSAQKIHEDNQTGMKILKAILSASTDATIEGLDEALMKKKGSLNKNFNVRLAGILVTAAGNFWATIQTICSIFGFVYVPPGSGPASSQYGYLISYEKIWEDTTSLTVPTGSLQMNLGNVVVAPISHVAMVRGVQEAYKIPDDPKANILYGESREALVRYPENPKGGRPMIIPLPDFISFAQTPPENTGAVWGTTVSLASPAKDGDWVKAEGTDFYNAVKQICSAICKQTYLDVALADSSANVTVPLDLTLTCGKMVDVSAEGGGKLFRGLLRAVSHSLASEPPTATTSLVFSHVQAGNYTIQ